MRQLADVVQRTRADAKADLPWVKLATLGQQRTPKGSLRHNANLVSITGVELDADDETMQPEEAAAKLRAAGVAAMVYTSPSHTPFKPRWRVLAPLSAPVQPEQRRRLAGVLNAIVGGVASIETFTNSQAYYIGATPATDDHHVTLIDGTPLDYVTGLEPVYPARKAPVERAELPPRDPAAPPDAYAEAVLDRLCEAFHGADAEGERHHVIRDVTLGIAPFVLSGHIHADQVAETIRGHLGRPANSGEIEALLDGALGMAQPHHEPTGGAEFGALPALAAPAPRKLFVSRDFRVDPNETYIVKHMIAPGNVCVLLGHPGAGKSTLAPYLAYAVAQGRPVFGMRTKTGRTLYIAAEDVRGVEKRIGALGRRYGDTDDCAVIGCGNLREPAAQAEVFATVAEFKPALIVLDTLAAAFAGLDENASQDMGAVVAFGRTLAASGAAVMFVHHPAKNGDGTPRGHGVLNGTLELTITLAPDDVHDPDTIIRGKLPKNKNGTTARDLAFRKEVIELGRDADGEPITTTLPVEVDADTAKAAKPVKQSAAEVKALAALHGLLDGPDTTDHAGHRAVSEQVWREACDARAITASDKPNSRAKAWRRAAGDLCATGLIGRGGGFVWVPCAGGEFGALLSGDAPGCGGVRGVGDKGTIRDLSPVSSMSPGAATGTDRDNTLRVVPCPPSEHPENLGSLIEGAGTTSETDSLATLATRTPEELVELIGERGAKAETAR